ncbi:MAG TPA: manganese efflux pump [Candidatus Acidoferrales bacterium]|nr:manganese efflux pump [Candidatus Acidoferrales bacterium]
MSGIGIVLIALALSVDNFSIALAVGAQRASGRFAALVRLPLVFGVFAAVAPVLGWLLGSRATSVVSQHAGIAAFVVLTIVGWRTLRSAWTPGGETLPAADSWPAALAMGLATSGDSLAVGFALGLAHTDVVALGAINGTICATLSLAGMLVGDRLGRGFPRHSKVAAGIVLIGIGVHALGVQL